MFKEIETRQSFPALEQQVEQWWQEYGVVEKVLAHGDRKQPFVFFEGPPTANGRPGVHHIESRTSKDVVIRYRRMQGQYILGARGGWDTHGLPVELEVEKQLGFSGKPDIEKYGIAEFNKACKESVWNYVQEWERLTNRIAYWIDLKDPYITYTNEYIESLWWILRTFWDRGLLFRDYKVTMHCPRCGTSLSDHEVSQGFEDNVDDPSVWVRFRVRQTGHELASQLAGASLLVWTTTPWTLPANVAVAVKPDADYVLVEYKDERLLLVQALADKVLGEGAYTVLATFKGNQLRDLRYENLFKGVPGVGEQVDWTHTYRVIADDYVSLEDGSGLVHIAPAYGDLEIGRTHGLPTLFSVDLAGNTLSAYDELGFGGLFFKKADPVITRNLKERGLLFKGERVRHSYPFCWRCHTPLLYYAKPSWYVRTTKFRDEMLSNNEQINWVPEHIKTGRFGNWLENNVDWALSRERYWGTPLPIWICDKCEKTDVVGSVAELSQKAGRDLKELDLHRPYVDEITWGCECGGNYHRVPDVADCWFDSGSMPVAQWHYPFENEEIFAQAGQADYISEAIDQTRGWFYTLHAISTLLFDRPAYKNVICLGHILDARGEKMSKSRGNVVNPWELLESYGADSTRWFMCASAPPYNSRNFSFELVNEMQRQFLLTLWNTYAFFVTYANIDGWQAPTEGDPFAGVELQLIDRWILARLNALIGDVTGMLDNYDIHGPTRQMVSFIEDLSNWYVRRNRRRFWKAESDQDKHAAYLTLYTCLTTLAKLLAPFTPYVSESLYQNLVASQNASAPQSVHMAEWPVADPARLDSQLVTDMGLLLETVNLGRSARQNASLRIRQPLSELLIRLTRSNATVEGLRRFESELRDELNIKSVRFLGVEDGLVEYYFKPNLPVLGKKHGRLIPQVRSALSALTGEVATQAAHKLEKGESVAIEVNGQELQLVSEDVLVFATSPEGYAVAESDGLVVALNTTVSPELAQEGIARDLVRLIQDARKSAGFSITDRIQVRLQPEGKLDLQAVLNSHSSVISSETLANSLELGASNGGYHTTTAELEGGNVVIAVQRV
ncbi:isoleucine--tRNA ligase [Ktedonobacter sp. SOSP1-52]|uniref:isoleucine--tRNA ligase n=1 Tax=Ktedonobacter sp. SOSP1-52 TaxID=2778366 RepID=UPI00191605DC|nr:isoleucine--tRNA ligase [Ktedonobacter sp. SOSP1-52]GHO69960.1 isoleucine--tRNA ligase [Ktedonobacter sp. SOSP1-52]